MAVRARTLWSLAALALAAQGCAGRSAAPQAPAPAPTPVAAAPTSRPGPAAAPAAAPTRPTETARSLAPVAATPSPRPATADAAFDSTAEEAFLDTLRTISADSGATHSGSLPPEVVRQEAAELFGPPPAAASAPTWDIDVATYAGHERVQAYVEYFTGRARRHFEVYLSRLGRYDSMIRGRLRAGGLPQDMIYLAMIESGLNPNAVSRSRAVGMWQFIAPTGRRYGLTIDPWVDERRDPFLSTDAAIRFLRELNNRFGSLYLAAAAYNSGPGKINRGLTRFDFGALEGDDVFFALAEERFLRRETQDYVPKLIAAALVAKQPGRYGFTDIVPLAPLRYDSVQVTDAVGVDVLARLSDTSQAAMEELNPQLVRRITPPGRTVWVRVPEGRSAGVTARLATLPPRERVTHLVHVIRRGETLGSIARLYHVDTDDITGANRGLKPRSLRVGRELIIPTSGVPSASRAIREAEARVASSARPSRRSPSARAPRPAAPRATVASQPATSRRVHIVRSGETLSGIADRFSIALSELLRANRLTARSRIRPGQPIRIPG